MNAWKEHATDLAPVVFDKFVINPDRYGYYTTDHNQFTSSDAITHDVIVSHFQGKGSIGTYPSIYPDNKCKWMCIDVDAHGEDATDRNWATVTKIVNWFAPHYVQICVEDSNGKGGYHIWCLFEPMNLLPIYQLGRQVLEDTKLTDVECFPKQKDLGATSKHLGNWVRLPGKHHKRDHWSRFFALPEKEKVNGKYQYAMDKGHWVDGDAAVDHFKTLPVNSSDAMELLWMATYTPEAQITHSAQPLSKGALGSDRVGQATKFANKYKVAIEGSAGDATAFSIMRNLYQGFALTPDECVQVVIKSRWNDACIPSWNISDLQHKATGAEMWSQAGNESEPRGYRITDDGDCDITKYVCSDAGLETFASFYDWGDEPPPKEYPYPFELLPAELATYIDEVARHKNTHPEFVATATMATIAAYLQNVVVSYRKGFSQVPPTLWALLIEEQSMGKKRGMDAAMKPVCAIEGGKEEDYQKQKRDKTFAAKAANGDLKAWWSHKNQEHLTTDQKFNDPTYQSMVDSAATLEDCGECSMLIQNATLQHLLLRMRDSGNRVFLASDESSHLKRWLGISDRKGACTEQVCQMWDGGDVHDGSIASGAKTVTGACLTMLSGIQPFRADEMLATREFSESGAGSRHIYCAPNRLPTNYQHEMSGNAVDWWEGVVNDVSGLTVERDDTSRPIPSVLSFDDAATAVLVSYSNTKSSMRNRMLLKGDSGLRIGVVNRAEDYVMKFATYLHFLRHRGEIIQHQICVDDVKTAIKIQKYYLRQIDRLTHRKTNEIEIIGEKIWKWLKDGRMEQARTEGIRVREINRSLFCRYKPETAKFGASMTVPQIIEAGIEYLGNDNRPVELQTKGNSKLLRILR